MVIVSAAGFASKGWATAAVMRNSGGGGCAAFWIQKTRDLVQQFGGTKRFGETIVGAQLECEIEKSIRPEPAAAGNGDDRNPRKALFGFADGLDALAVRHDDIGDDHRGVRAFDGAQAGLPVLGIDHSIT